MRIIRCTVSQFVDAIPVLIEWPVSDKTN